MRRSRLFALAIAAALVVAGCSASDLVGLLTGGRLPGGFGDVPTTAPSMPSSPEPTDPAASDLLSASWTTLPVPGESIEWAAPPEWTTVDLATLRRDIVAQLNSSTTPDAYRPLIATLLKSFDDGFIRLVIRGTSPGGTATSDVSIAIGPQVTDLAAAAAAMRRITPELPNSTVSGPEPVTLALGDGLRYQWVQNGDNLPAQYIPADNVAVVTLLPDGRCIWVEGSAPAAEDGWPDFVTRLADEIRIP